MVPDPHPPDGPGGPAGRRPLAPGAGDRVTRSHAQARAALRWSLAFLLAGAVAAAVGGDRWFALHLVLAGGVVSAISGVSLMLTVTWSAAPAPPDGQVRAQRLAVVVGAATVAVARHLDLPVALVAAGAVVYVGALGLLAFLLVRTARRGVERRFDAAVGAYLAALLAGTTGVVVGAVMAVDGTTTAGRNAHAALNVLGLVGLVIAGTLPYFSATVGRSKMAARARRPRLMAITALLVVALAVAAAGLAAEAAGVAVAGLVAYAVGIAAVVAMLPRPTRRQLTWAGPRLVALWAGSAWWAVGVVATAVEAARDDGGVVLGGRWLLVIVVAGYLQVLWGSLAYLLPMLRGGGPQRLSQGFATTRSWLGLAMANGAGLALAVGAPAWVPATLVAVWVLDSLWRAARIGTQRAERPDAA